jgi:hypothetical protein
VGMVTCTVEYTKAWTRLASDLEVKGNSATIEAASSRVTVKVKLEAKVKMESRAVYERDFRNACDGWIAEESWKPEKRELAAGVHLFYDRNLAMKDQRRELFL